MQKMFEEFGFAIRNHRKREGITQTELAEALNMSVRTIQGIESSKSNPHFETVLLIARKLNISLDSILFPNAKFHTIPKCAIDFFANKSESETQKYIDICKQIENLK